MLSQLASLGQNRRAGYSIALIALLSFGGFQIIFLSLDAYFQFGHQVMILEALIALVVTIGCVVLIAREDRRSENADAIAERQLSHLADFATDLYWETDLEGKIITTGGRLMSTITPDTNRILGRHYLDVIKLDESESEKMVAALREIKPYSDILSVMHDPSGQRYYISLSATPRYNRKGEIVGYLGVGTNVTRRIEAQSKLRRMAEQDMLTGLANRYAFQNRIDQDLMETEEEQNVALLAIDLDNFKAINDTYGHQVGDALLALAAKRLLGATRKGDWAARLGGDEFVIVCPQVTNPMDACLMAARVIAALSRPYQIGGLELTISASIGVACAPQHAQNSRALMKCADLALYEAKGNGRDCYHLFEGPPAEAFAPH
ncbi:MAG: sensor domain-containing diguanylate cyclase [Pseudomonadota bacterium]